MFIAVGVAVGWYSLQSSHHVLILIIIKKGFREIFIVLIESQPAMLFNSKMTILCSLCYCCFPLNFPLGMNKVANIVIDGINKHHHKKVQYSTVFCDITVGYSFISCGCKTVKPISKTLFIKHIRQMIH